QAEAPHREGTVGFRLRRRSGRGIRLGVGKAHDALSLSKTVRYSQIQNRMTRIAQADILLVAGHGDCGGKPKVTSDPKRAEGITMKIEIIEKPIRFHLHGIRGIVENERFGEVGMGLMNEMWQIVKEAGILTTGINHWVYLPDGKMFVGVELRNPRQVPLP